MVRRHILLVDDDPGLRLSLREGLRLAGYDPFEAVDGVEGLDRAQKGHPNAIVLDARMPGLDGYEVCRGLKANPATQAIPVIFLTGGADNAGDAAAYAAGATACVKKPCRIETLTALLEAVIINAERHADPGPHPHA
jgi:CheY-like chemotaxis protein